MLGRWWARLKDLLLIGPLVLGFLGIARFGFMIEYWWGLDLAFLMKFWNSDMGYGDGGSVLLGRLVFGRLRDPVSVSLGKFGGLLSLVGWLESGPSLVKYPPLLWSGDHGLTAISGQNFWTEFS
jgi:hypothetical protein